MTTHFNWSPDTENQIIPWNARFEFPSVAARSQLLMPRIPPTNGTNFSPGQTIRLELPAQAYVNPHNTTITFDLTLYNYVGGTGAVRLQNGAASVFNRVVLKYGSSVIEDIRGYNDISRILIEHVGTNGQNSVDESSIAEGQGGVVTELDGSGGYYGQANVRQKMIQSIESGTVPVAASDFFGGTGWGIVPQGTDRPFAGGNGGTFSTRRYTLPFLLGMFIQDKLIGTKFMASQFAIELTLEEPAATIFAPHAAGFSASPTYTLGNVVLMPEMLLFDQTFDATFVAGLEDGGVMYKFSSWRQYSTSLNSANISFSIGEKSRWIKSIFVVQKRATPTFTTDQGACYFDTSLSGASTLQTFQFRAGGKFFPPSPVECSANGSAVTNGGSEAMVEVQKAFRSYNDKRLSSSMNTQRWAMQNAAGVLHDQDYKTSIINIGGTGIPTIKVVESLTNAFSGTVGSQMFVMAANFDSSTRGELAGLNGEEQNQITFNANWKLPQVMGSENTPSTVVAYTYYDSVFILGANNTAKLIE
tara:strand:+ start:496 stop:2085 length:1590 start_codon:yes stop_codon:yes gene_type:complete